MAQKKGAWERVPRPDRGLLLCVAPAVVPASGDVEAGAVGGRVVFEGGVGVRSSSVRGSAVCFGDLEAGMAVIAYDNADRSGTRGSPYFGLRGGAEWPMHSRVRVIVQLGTRVYPPVSHVVGHVSVGLACGL